MRPEHASRVCDAYALASRSHLPSPLSLQITELLLPPNVDVPGLRKQPFAICSFAYLLPRASTVRMRCLSSREWDASDMSTAPTTH
ncbi:hypothetical protein MRX96_045788 [Rhipicephalus microplus]